MTANTIIIDGNNFSDAESFYREVDNVLTSGLDWATGHNLAAFNDLLYGGFGIYEYEDHIKLTWKNSEKSKKELNGIFDGKTLYETLVDIIKEHEHIQFTEA